MDKTRPRTLSSLGLPGAQLSAPARSEFESNSRYPICERSDNDKSRSSRSQCRTFRVIDRATLGTMNLLFSRRLIGGRGLPFLEHRLYGILRAVARAGKSVTRPAPGRESQLPCRSPQQDTKRVIRITRFSPRARKLIFACDFLPLFCGFHLNSAEDMRTLAAIKWLFVHCESGLLFGCGRIQGNVLFRGLKDGRGLSGQA